MTHFLTAPLVAAGLAITTGATLAQSAYPGLTYGLGGPRQAEAQVTLFYPDGTPSVCDSAYAEDDVTLTLNPCKLGWDCINALRGVFNGLANAQPGLQSAGEVRLSGPMILANYAFNVSCQSALGDDGKLLSTARIVPMTEVKTGE